MAKTPEEYKPTLDDLGALMRARTRNDLGDELGTFNEETRPTGDEAQSMIDQALDLVSPRLGGSVPDRLEGLARSIVTLRAAMLVEASYSPEGDGPETATAYSRFETQYQDALEAYDMAAGHDAGQSRRKAGTLRVGTYLAQQSE